MDTDLTQALGSTPTTGDKLYAEAIEDNRAQFVEVKSLEQQRVENCARHAAASEKLANEWAAKVPPLVFDDWDNLYQRCVFTGVEIRKQNMTTTTTRETVMQDVINDGIWIGEQLYAHFRAKKGL